MKHPLVQRLKKEAFLYGALYIALALYMHPERISLVSTPLQLLHSFFWVFLVYIALIPFRIIVTKVIKKFKN
jgi:hypothetical protein